MPWTQAHTKLRDLLVELYPMPQGVRLVVADALMNADRIDFSGASASIWQSVLEEAERQDKMLAIMDVVRKDYGNNPRVATTLDQVARDLTATVDRDTSQVLHPPAGQISHPGIRSTEGHQAYQRPTIPFDWVTIPAGEFWMGSDTQHDQEAEANERERHSVHLATYRIARTPVTVEQFERFVQTTGYRTTAETTGGARDLTKGLRRDSWDQHADVTWRTPRGAGSQAQSSHPVTCMSWQDAMEFCGWAGVRLPTEAEWEKAAAWDAENEGKRIYPWGAALPDENRCNFDLQVGSTTPVGRYPAGATPTGLLDMAGNVWEWTSSLYRAYPYRPERCEIMDAAGERVLRGGSFYQQPRYLRCTYRNRHGEDAAVSDYGFRCCAVELMGEDR